MLVRPISVNSNDKVNFLGSLEVVIFFSSIQSCMRTKLVNVENNNGLKLYLNKFYRWEMNEKKKSFWLEGLKKNSWWIVTVGINFMLKEYKNQFSLLIFKCQKAQWQNKSIYIHQLSWRNIFISILLAKTKGSGVSKWLLK